ncbi:MAG: FdhF/YdeP family oxidoreductase [Bacteroidota bacterium]
MQNQPYVGGWKSVYYSMHVAKEVGLGSFYRSITSKNTCKTCAYGMGGQKGGMINEAGDTLEICKKSIQAQLTDLQAAIQLDFFEKNSIQDLQKLRPRELERLGRLDSPIYKKLGDSHYSNISWEEALQKIISKYKNTVPERTFFYSSGRSSNEAAFLLHLFSRLYGTNNVNNCSYYCHQASGVGMSAMLGTGTATVELNDLKNSDLIFVIGANPASNHPRFVTELMHCRRRGGKVVIINPLKEPGLVKFAIPSDVRSFLTTGSEIASHYLQPKIGTDVAVLMGIAKYLIDNQQVNFQFIANHTEGFTGFAEKIKATSWTEIESCTGLQKENIEVIAQLYADSKNVVFTWAMGITHQINGVENVEAIVNIALLRGMIGRKNAGLLPLRGHSNVQGVGSIGVMPTLKKKIFENIEAHFKITLPKTEGWDTMKCMDEAYAGKVDIAFLMGGNLYGSNPNQAYAEKSLNAIPFKVFLTTTINEGHLKGIDNEVLILPVLARDEEVQATTQESMFNYVRLSDGGLGHLKNAKSEVEILVKLAQSVIENAPFDFSIFEGHATIRQAIGAIIPGYEPIATIDTSKEEFQIEGRTFHEPSFDMPNGKALFAIPSIPSFEENPTHFRLMTIRSEGQFNSIIYEEEDAWRGQKERAIVLMNPLDMAERGLIENQLISLKNKVGELANLKLRPFNIARGCLAGYYPEMNVLVPSTVDPRSKTPAFKNVAVWIDSCGL